MKRRFAIFAIILGLGLFSIPITSAQLEPLTTTSEETTTSKDNNKSTTSSEIVESSGLTESSTNSITTQESQSTTPEVSQTVESPEDSGLEEGNGSLIMVLEIEDLQVEVVYKIDESLKQGEEKVLQEGKAGKAEFTVYYLMKNGTQVFQKKELRSVIDKGTPKIIAFNPNPKKEETTETSTTKEVVKTTSQLSSNSGDKLTTRNKTNRPKNNKEKKVVDKLPVTGESRGIIFTLAILLFGGGVLMLEPQLFVKED